MSFCFIVRAMMQVYGYSNKVYEQNIFTYSMLRWKLVQATINWLKQLHVHVQQSLPLKRSIVQCME